MGLSFDATREEKDLIYAIVDRFKEGYKSIVPFDRLSIIIDLVVTNANGNPIDFEKLLNARDEDFFHDVGGIIRYIDRTTGKLEECFSPRCSK